MINMKHNLIATVYNISKPFDSVFRKIYEYADLCNINDDSINEKRKIKFAHLILLKSRAYLDSLKTWNFRQATNKTYEEMKVFMHEESQYLEIVGALTVGDSLN